MNNYTICVTTCSKYLNDRIPIQKRFCFDKTGYKIFTGEGKQQYTNHITLKNCTDDYFELRKKTFAVFEWFLANTDSQYIVKCDDDTFIDVNQLDKLPDYDYCGPVTTFTNSAQSVKYHIDYVKKITNKSQNLSYFNDIKFCFKYAEGSCYILKRSILERLVEYHNTKTIPPIIQEDITVGYISHLLGIKLVDHMLDIKWYDSTHYSYHPCTPGLFPLLAATNNTQKRIQILHQHMHFNNHYQKYFDL